MPRVKMDTGIGTSGKNMNHRENSLLRHGQTKDSRDPSTPARSPGSFAVGQDDRVRTPRSRSVRMTGGVGRQSSYLHRIWKLEIRKTGNQQRETGSQTEAGKKKRRRRSRNMARYPMVRKDYGFPSYFARSVRYNGQALVYSELLARSSAFARKSAAFRPKDRPQ